MNREARDAEQKIGLGITAYVCAAESGEVAAVADDPEAVLESLGAHVHLVVAEVNPHPEVMLVTDEFERVAERVDVRSTLERRVAAIADCPVAAGHDCRDQSAAIGARKAGTTGDPRLAPGISPATRLAEAQVPLPCEAM